ncbi:hypothetical protein HPB50_012011 [Hyalomma asiaticum]|uniref:Uncharacterized protein n=1 Tax=Hyalomma asiaticum TaxID=266040 RepID=A0ACB7RRT4_HYAAI|nr:hypothetical protein HPB50_012011 [Hyalomma asiaticum]
MGRPRKVRSPEEEAAYREARRAADRERDRRRRLDPAYVAKETAAKRRRRANPEYARRENEKEAARKRARRRQPGVGRAEYERRKARASTEVVNSRFVREFGHPCKVCDRPWFNANLSTVSSVRCNEKQPIKAPWIDQLRCFEALRGRVALF